MLEEDRYRAHEESASGRTARNYDRLNESIVDLICEECRFRGIAGLAFYRRQHLLHHDEHRNGVRLRHLESFERVGEIGSFPVLLVRPESNLFSRRRTERVSRRAIREPLDEGGYDKPTFYAENRYYIVPEMRSHALVVANQTRAIAIAVIERRDRDAWYKWSEAVDGYVLNSVGSAGNAWSVAHIWVLSAFRKRGLAGDLLKMGFRGFATDPTEAGWMTPFTSGGLRLVRHFSPFGFWNAGYKPSGLESVPIPFNSGDQ